MLGEGSLRLVILSLLCAEFCPSSLKRERESEARGPEQIKFPRLEEEEEPRVLFSAVAR